MKMDQKIMKGYSLRKIARTKIILISLAKTYRILILRLKIVEAFPNKFKLTQEKEQDLSR